MTEETVRGEVTGLCKEYRFNGVAVLLGRSQNLTTVEASTDTARQNKNKNVGIFTEAATTAQTYHFSCGSCCYSYNCTIVHNFAAKNRLDAAASHFLRD